MLFARYPSDRLARWAERHGVEALSETGVDIVKGAEEHLATFNMLGKDGVGRIVEEDFPLYQSGFRRLAGFILRKPAVCEVVCVVVAAIPPLPQEIRRYKDRNIY